MNDLNNAVSPQVRSIDTLAAFVQDAEHDLLSVVTALQANLDLLHDEQVRNQLPVSRFAALNRAIARIVTDTTVLASISELALAPRSKRKLALAALMEEIVAETESAFSQNQVSLSCDIATGTTLLGEAVPVKSMITAMILALLDQCVLMDTISIVGLTDGNQVTISFDIGREVNESKFKPWRLGELRLMPINGDTIGLAAVAAMARLQHGQLSASTRPNLSHGYKLTFQV